MAGWALESRSLQQQGEHMTTEEISLAPVDLDLNGCRVRLENRHVILFGRQDNFFYTPCDPAGLPDESDQSDFAKLYRAFHALREEGVVEGHFRENTIHTYDFFHFLSKVEPPQLLHKLEEVGVSTRVMRVLITEDQRRIVKALADLDPWVKGKVRISHGSLEELLERAKESSEELSGNRTAGVLMIVAGITVLALALYGAFALWFYAGLVLLVIYVALLSRLIKELKPFKSEEVTNL